MRLVNLHLSDLCAVTCPHTCSNVDSLPKTHRYNSFRSFQGLNEFKLMNDLIIVPWSVLDACDDLNDVEHNFGKMLHAVWDKHAPVKQRLMQDAPLLWMTGDIACMMTSRDAAF